MGPRNLMEKNNILHIHWLWHVGALGGAARPMRQGAVGQSARSGALFQIDELFRTILPDFIIASSIFYLGFDSAKHCDADFASQMGLGRHGTEVCHVFWLL